MNNMGFTTKSRFISIASAVLIAFNHMPSSSVCGNPVPVQSDSAGSGRDCPEITSDNICVSAKCVEAASMILDSANFTKDPCIDFSEFSCSKWVENANIPTGKSSVTRFSLLDDRLKIRLQNILEDERTENSYSKTMAKLAFKKCMDQDTADEHGSQPLQSALLQLGGIPWMDSEWSAELAPPLSEMIAVLRNDFMVNGIVNMYMWIDAKNSTSYIFNVGDPRLMLDSRDFYLNDSEYGHLKDALKNMLIKFSELYSEDTGFKPPNDYEKQIDELIAFETKIAEIKTRPAAARNVTARYNVFSRDQLKSTFPWIDWETYFEVVLPEDVKQAFKNNLKIQVSFPQNLKKFGKLISESDPKTVYNYFSALVIYEWSAHLDSRYEANVNAFRSAIFGRHGKKPRREICLSRVSRGFKYAVGSLYVDKHFTEEDRKEAEDMVKFLQLTFEKLLGDLEWMDQDTKAKALAKSSAMLRHIAYPDYIKDPLLLDEEYKYLSLNESANQFDFYRQFRKWQLQDEARKLLNPFNRKKFDIGVAVVNAFYHPLQNSVVFPAGILQPPFFNSKFPKYINYGAIGTVIGHEITHGFDDQGRKYDLQGNLNDWWSPSSKANYRKKSKCVVDQYHDYRIESLGMNVNGELSQGENIADNGGLKIAYMAYEAYLKSNDLKEEPQLPGLQQYNSRQLFFMSFANIWCAKNTDQSMTRQLLLGPHSPNPVRIIGSLSNLDQFSSAFQCKKGSPMNPENSNKTKCEIW